MRDEILGGILGTALSAAGTATQTNELLQTISLGITIIGGVISLIILPLVNWWRNARKDGKITKEEIDEAIDIVDDGLKEINQSKDNKEE